jgi:hypothetical protein
LKIDPSTNRGIVSIRTAREFLNWHPHLHFLAPAGTFRTDGSLVPSPVLDAAVLRGLFQASVLSLLLKERMISSVTSHIPYRGTQLVHYYGAYSNAHRGIARRREVFIEVPPEDEPYDPPPRPDSAWHATRRKSWARLIRRVYEVDPLLCRCGERMRVVGFITQPTVILKILHHFGWRFDPLKLPGRSPPLLDHFCPDPFPRTYGPQ